MRLRVVTTTAAADQHVLALLAVPPGQPWTLRAAHILTELGKTPGYLYLVLGFAVVDAGLALALTLLLVLSELVNAAIKHLVRRSRPLDCLSGPRAGLIEGRYSFPSCHAQNAAAIWGYLILTVGSLPAILGGLAFILAVGWARLRLGEHYLSDIIAGWIIGAALASLAHLMV